MDDNIIKQKLDQLAEFHDQATSLGLKKRELLDEVKVPLEVEAVVKNGMAQIAGVEDAVRRSKKAQIDAIQADYDSATVPDHLKEALAEIERQRAAIVIPADLQTALDEIETRRKEALNKKRQFDQELLQEIKVEKEKIQSRVESETRDVYSAVEQRRREIEVEFEGKSDDVSENIKKLEAEIKDDIKRRASEKLAANPKCKDLSVKGRVFHAVFTKPRKTWIPAKLEDYTENHPEIRDCYTEGEPSVTIRPI